MEQKQITHKNLSKLLADGAVIKTTLLTEKFSYEDYHNQPKENRIPLFAIDTGEHIHPVTPEPDFSLKADWKIIGLSMNRQP